MSLVVRDVRRAQRVGAVSLVILAGLIALLVTHDGCTLRPGFGAIVYFDRLGGLSEGADVQVAGRVIGEITAISLVPSGREDGVRGRGGVAVQVRIENRFAHMAPINGEYFISSKGLLGERFIEIAPPAGMEPPQRQLRAGDEVRGIDPPHLDRAMWRTYQNLLISRRFAEAVAPESRELGRALTELSDTLAGLGSTPDALSGAAASVARFSEAVQETRASWAAGQVSPGDVRALAQAADDTLDRIDTALGDIRARLDLLGYGVAILGHRLERGNREARARLADALARAGDSVGKVQHMVAGLRDLVSLVRGGHGTIGALANDPEFPEDAKQLGRIIKRRPWKLIGRPRQD